MQDDKGFVMFHASKHSFSAPDLELLAKNREGHANGALGLWVAKKSDWIEGFGEHLYEVRIKGTIEDLSIEELSKWANQSSDADFYEFKRSALMARGVQYLRLAESDGRSEMGVLLDFGAIECFQSVPQHEEEEHLQHPEQMRM